MKLVAGDEEEQNQDDVKIFKKNEEEWLLQTPLDDELGIELAAKFLMPI